MTQRVKDTWGAEYNRQWKAQQPKPKPSDKPAIVVPRAKPEPIKTKPQQNQPRQNQQGPQECEGCVTKESCKGVLKLWHMHAPRPELVRGWCQLIDQNAARMVCLTKLGRAEP
jgi:hypothetical protein